MYRFLLSARWLRYLAGALAVAAVCTLLGFWQLDRLQDRRARNAVVQDNLARPVAPVAEVLLPGRDLAPADQWRRVRVTGRYDEAQQLLVRNRPFKGSTGYYVLTPLRTDEGPAVLVNRGWIPAGRSAARPDELPAPPGGVVTVVGRTRVSEPASPGPRPAGQVRRIDVPAIAADLPYPLYGGYLDRITEDPRARPSPEVLVLPELGDGPHLVYAVQWWLFALLALGGFLVLARREAADRGAPPPVRRAPARAG